MSKSKVDNKLPPASPGKLAPFDRMFDRYQTFKPAKGYENIENQDDRYLEYNHGLRIRSSLLADIILADYDMRAFAQMQDSILVHLAVLQKIIDEDDDSDHAQDFIEQLAATVEGLKEDMPLLAKRYKQRNQVEDLEQTDQTEDLEQTDQTEEIEQTDQVEEIDLLETREVLEGSIIEVKSKLRTEVWVNHWDNEMKLPQFPLKEIYDKIREDPTWYLRKELVQICISSGGCCGQKCKCCDTRHIGRETMKGLGHCTDNCLCCHRRHSDESDCVTDYFDYRQKSLEQSLSSRNPAPLLTLAEAYFTLPDKSGLGTSSFTRKVAWRSKSLIPWQWKRVAEWWK
ncbi:hypothetical protein N7456_010434 [Penicillium angulare]|uniref:Uncharacterized protein n=1 Tax=Penicillium angulare TaxID=116970 RepID=A0A9W9K659_9EURO|nr:hypothetical protein N7456_010434 [Penicillium angulare]